MRDLVSTFRGINIPIDKMSHQHVSNWIHYARYVMESNDHVEYFEEVLNKRFDGKLLMYRPQSDYYHEMEILKEKGMIEEDTGKVFTPDGSLQIGQVE